MLRFDSVERFVLGLGRVIERWRQVVDVAGVLGGLGPLVGGRLGGDQERA